MLHWLVSEKHTKEGQASLYHEHFKNRFLSFLSLCDSATPRQNYQSDLILDCANGVGATAISQIQQLPGFNEKLQITLLNYEKSPENLNNLCGAEYVQKDQKLPTGWSSETHANKKCMSFDGDADRQMYFYGDEQGKLHMIDGDKQFALIMMYIQGLLKKLNLLDKLSHILVQTAYCNSRVTKFLNDNGIKN